MAQAISTSQTVYQLQEVFTPRKIPTVTWIDRSSRPEYKNLRFNVTAAGGLVNVYGASRSGKTVMCLTLLKDKDPVLLNGGLIDTEGQFWSQLAKGLSLGKEMTYETFSERADQQTAEAEARIGLFGAHIGAGKKAKDSSRSGEGKTIKSITDSFDVVNKIIQSGRPIIIDDFHNIDRDLRETIIQRSKAATDLGATIVLVSIPKELEELVQDDRKRDEKIGRHASQEAPLWTPAEIRQIAELGFRALGIVVNDDAIDTLTQLAYRNPLLMQLYCLRLCFDHDIERTQQQQKTITLKTGEVHRIVREVASNYDTSFSDYLKVNSEDGKNWKLKNETLVNIYTLAGLAIAGVAIQSPVKLATIVDRIEGLLSPDVTPPSTAVVQNALTHITRVMSKRKEAFYKPELQVDGRGYWYITHPFFKVYLQWRLVPQFVDFKVGKATLQS